MNKSENFSCQSQGVNYERWPGLRDFSTKLSVERVTQAAVARQETFMNDIFSIWSRREFNDPQ
jgi:hypothetical protein